MHLTSLADDQSKHKTLDTITLFHKPSVAASTRVLTLIKTAKSTAAESATEDQASDHSHHTHPHREDFDLEVTEAAPTKDQLRTIFDYVGTNRVTDLVAGAKDEKDAMTRIAANPDAFQRPVVNQLNPTSLAISCL